MSMHSTPLTQAEEAGLRAHGLKIGTPSQLSDAFRQGMAYALAAPAQQPGLLEWAVARWRDEVQHRPLMNRNRRSLDDVWRQVIRYAGGDPTELIGPPHDDLAASNAPQIEAPSVK